MDDLISRQALLEEYDRLHVGEPGRARKLIEDAPSVQPERKTGKWIQNDNGTYSCSLCQSWIPEEQHYYARYCLYCGAEMRSEDNG